MHVRPGPRRGAALLEVIVALSILAVAGISAVTMAAESGRAVSRMREADRAMRRASAFLDAVALWSRADLDRRLGDHPQGPWRLEIQRPRPTLYLVALRDSAAGRELLQTALFRPAPNDAR
jgi:type II secretory pathway pseudopilin PulG